MTIVAIVILALFFIISVSLIGLWKWCGDKNLIGAIFLIWSFVIIFSLIVFFTRKNFESAKPAKSGTGQNFSTEN